MKRLIATVLSVLFIMFSTGCNESGGVTVNNNKPWKTLPDYEQNKASHLKIGGYYTPKVNDASFKEYADCGFDVMWINGENVGGYGGESQYVKNALELAGKYNLKCIIDASVSRNRAKKNDDLTAAAHDYGYQNYPALWAMDAYDEPVTFEPEDRSKVGIDTVAAYIPKFQEIYGETMPFFTNLFAMHASSLGTTFGEYLKQNIEQIVKKTSPKAERWISCDNYVYIYDPGTEKYSLQQNWLYNLQLLANEKLKNPELDIHTNFFILSMPHITDNQGRWFDRQIGYNELRMQMYSLIAFGYDMVSFFCYATPTSGKEIYRNALVDLNGEKTQTWDDSKKIISEIRKFDRVFMQFDYKGVITATGTENSNSFGGFTSLTELDATQIGDLQEVKGTSDTLVGVAKDAYENDGYTVVNYNDPYYKNKDTVEMTFKNAKYACVYKGGVKEDIKLVNHILTLDLDVGEGVFVIPY